MCATATHDFDLSVITGLIDIHWDQILIILHHMWDQLAMTYYKNNVYLNSDLP